MHAPDPQSAICNPRSSIAAAPSRRRIEAAVAVGCLAFSGLAFLTVAGLFILNPPPARAACNPATQQNCCVSTESNVCENLSQAGAERAEAVDGCNGAEFDLVGLYPGTNRVDTWTLWSSLDASFSDCPTNTLASRVDTFPGSVEWVVTGADDEEIARGGGTHAAVDDVCGRLTCTFTVHSDPGADCGEASYSSYAATTNAVGLTLAIPKVIGVNDLVGNCADPAGYPAGFVETAEEFNLEDDLHGFTWSACPSSLGSVGISTGDRLRALLLEGESVVVASDLSEGSAPKLEGVEFSELPGDAVVTLTYAGCTAQDTATVVRVQLDKFCYNRADPYPEVEVDTVEGLAPGGEATVRYRVLPDILGPGTNLVATFTAEEDLGTYEYRTPDYANRLGNLGHDAIRYTVFDNAGTKAVRWFHADPSRKALAGLPGPARMDIELKEALAETPAAALGHLAPKPAFAGPVAVEGARPSYSIPGVKVFARQPNPAGTNEVHAQVGNEEVLQTLDGVARDSAVVLEVAGRRLVVVNDRFTAGENGSDPGDDAAAQDPRSADDEDFVKLTLAGVPDCIAKGTVQWEVTAGDDRARLVFAPGDDVQVATVVSQDFSGGTPGDALLSVHVEGRDASEAIDDVTVTARVIVDDSEDNPRAFRGETLTAEFNLTVTDQRWTGWKADDLSGKTDERTDLRVCDLDLRPAVKIDQPAVGENVVYGSLVSVRGEVRSMLDVVRDITVNGERVSTARIKFLGHPVGGLTDESLRRLTDRPPPYVVQFEHPLASLAGTEIRVEARNGIGPHPGRAAMVVAFTNAPLAAGIVGKVLGSGGSAPAYDLPDMVEFFDGGGAGWKFLNKAEVDHCGRGDGIVECVETCGAQPGVGLYRLRLPMLFLDDYGTDAGEEDYAAIPGPGLLLTNVTVHGAEPMVAQYDNGLAVGVRKLFPVDLKGKDGTGLVPDVLENSIGTVLIAGQHKGKLRVMKPYHADLPPKSELKLAAVPVDGLDNPFGAFAEMTWEADEITEAFVEVDISSSTVGAAVFELTMDAPFGTGDERRLLAKDRVRVNVVEPPRLLAVSESFSPRQLETPPYHAGRIDFVKWNVPSGAVVRLALEILDGGEAYVRNLDPQAAAEAYTPVYRTGNLYALPSDLYGFAAHRLGWDGRYDADADGVVDAAGGTFLRWAEQPATTSAAGKVFKVRFSMYNHAGDLLDRTGEEEMRTTPLPFDGQGSPLFGPAPYTGLFAGQVDSRRSCVSLSGPAVVPASDGRPVPRFETFFDGNDWRHTALRFGWSHTYDIRVVPAFAAGARKLYVAWAGNHMLGPAEQDGTLWVLGERAKLLETKPDAEWKLTLRDGTALLFGNTGQPTSIKDRNGNEVVLAFSDAWHQDYIRRLDSVEGCGLTLSLSYDQDARSVFLSSAELAGRTLSFSYHSAETQVYAAPYPSDERLREIAGDEYTQTFGYKDGCRTNRASRVVGGEVTNRVVGAIAFNYRYETPQDLQSVVGTSKLNGFHIGTPDNRWMVTELEGSTATCAGIVESHAYEGNKLQSITHSPAEGGVPFVFQFAYDANGRRTKRSCPGGVVTLVPDDQGNVVSITYPGSDYSPVTLEYGKHNQLANRSVSTPPRNTAYTLDDKGNVVQVTQSGSGQSRAWTIVRNDDGTARTVTDPKGGTATYEYNDLGLETSYSRAGVATSREYDDLGRLVTSTDAAGNATSHAYDKWDRSTETTYPTGDTETREYRPLGELAQSTDAAGLTTVHSFDAVGKPTGRTESGAGVDYAFSYGEVDDLGRATLATVSGGGASYSLGFAYDALGRVVSRTLGGASLGSLSFDAFGNVLSATDGVGNTTTCEYYSDGAAKRVDRPEGMGHSQYLRDGVGNLLVHTLNPGGSRSPTMVATTVYDAFDQPVSVTDPRGKTWTHAYDDLGNLVMTTDPEGRTTAYEYDAREYRREVRLPGGASLLETRDANGDRTDLRDPKGAHWGTGRDALRRVATVAPPEGAPLTLSRTLHGAVTSLSVGGRTTTATLDAWSRATAVQAPSGASRTAVYDPVGVKSATDMTGVASSLDRDPDGKVASVNRAGVATEVTMDGNFDVVAASLAGQYLDRSRSIERDANGLPTSSTAACGAQSTARFNGLGMLEEHSAPATGSMQAQYDAGGDVASLTLNNRTIAVGRDDVGNPTSLTLPDGRQVSQSFDARDALAARSTPLGGGTTRSEAFERDANRNVKKHTVGPHATHFAYDAANRLIEISSMGGISRQLAYAPDGQVSSDSVGNQSTTFTYDADGFPSGISVAGGGSYALAHDAEGRTTSAGGYSYTYNGRKHLTKVTDNHPGPGGQQEIGFDPDSAGYGWTRTLPGSVALAQEINDIGTVTKSSLSDGSVAGTATFGFAANDQVRPTSIVRTGGAPGSALACNAQKEVLSVVHGEDSAGATQARSATTGYVTARALLHVGRLETFDLNAEGWILGESRQGAPDSAYEYRADGVRTSHTLGGATARFEASLAGAVEAVLNAQLGEKLRAPLESPSVRYVGGPQGFPSVEAALTNLLETVGTNTFAVPQVVVVRSDVYAADIGVGAQFAGLAPTAANPLVIRGGIDRRTALTGRVAVSGVPNVRLQGFHIASTNAGPAAVFADAGGAALASCVVLGPVAFTNCPGARAVGNTFDDASAAGRLDILDCPGAVLCNNAYLNDGTDAGVSWDVQPDSDYNAYHPDNGYLPAEANSLYEDPGLLADGSYRPQSSLSAVVAAGEPQAGFQADVRGWYRHLAAPCVGAVECGLEQEITRDAGGRIVRRFVAGRRYDYAYDARGQLVEYTDHTDSRRSATYAYDHLGNRIRIAVGAGTPAATVTRCVYQGKDVVAEFVDTDADGDADRRRVYWILPELDQRIGFVDYDEEGDATLYYYLCDPAGSVQQVVAEDGEVVNQYDYDAFGNIRWENSFEGIPNRYTFQGREWDAHAAHYHYRYRTYVPEWGSFTGPDMNLALGILGEPNGVGSYLFCNNNPAVWTDPEGLASETAAFDAAIINGRPMVRRRTLSWTFWSGGRGSAKEVQGSRTDWQPAQPDDWMWFTQTDDGSWETVGYGMAAARKFGRDAPQQAKGFAMAFGAVGAVGAFAAAPMAVGGYLLGEAAEEAVDRATGLPVSLVTAVVDPKEVLEFATRKSDDAAVYLARKAAGTVNRNAPEALQEGLESAAKSAKQLGREGEALASQITGAAKNTESWVVHGRTRIPDQVLAQDIATRAPTIITEVKNVQYQSLTRQLRDYADLAGPGGRVDVALPPGAKVSGPLRRAFRDPDNPLNRLDLMSP